MRLAATIALLLCLSSCAAIRERVAPACRDQALLSGANETPTVIGGTVLPRRSATLPALASIRKALQQRSDRRTVERQIETAELWFESLRTMARD